MVLISMAQMNIMKVNGIVENGVVGDECTMLMAQYMKVNGMMT